MKKLLIVLLGLLSLTIFNIVPALCYDGDDNTEIAGVIVTKYAMERIESDIESLNFILLQETDKIKQQSLTNVIKDLKNIKKDLEHLGRVIKIYNKKNNELGQKIKATRDDNGSVPCAACNGTGVSNGKTCKTCGGDGAVWTPDSNGSEVKCGRCKGTGYISSGVSGTKECPGCNGSGWANASPNPRNVIGKKIYK